MVVSVLATGITVSAADGETGTEPVTATEVWYCGAKLDATNKYLMTGSISYDEASVKACSESSGSGLTKEKLLAEFDAKTGTLTFKGDRNIIASNWNPGVYLKQIDTNGDNNTSDEKYYGIYAKGNLTIELGSYVNLLYLARQQPTDYGQEGIHVEGDLIVNGNENGMLRVTANPAGKNNGGLLSYGVNVTGTVTLNGGIIDVYETTWNMGSGFYLDQNYTKLIKANDVKLNGGSLYLRARKTNSPATNKTLHEIGTNNEDTINVPAAYKQEWASEFEYAPNRTDGSTNYDRNKGNDGNTKFNSSRQTGDMYVKYTPMNGFKIKVMGQELGGDEKYLHVSTGSGNKTVATVNADSTEAAAEYNITKNADGTLTKELKFLKNTSLFYQSNTIASVIESDSDLDVNLNNFNVKLQSAAEYKDGVSWPYLRAVCIFTVGDLTVDGGGNLVGLIGGDAIEDKENASDRFASAVIYSGGELKFGDVDATLFIAKERNGAKSAQYPQSNVIYADKLTVGTDTSLKLRKIFAPTDNEAAGYLIGGVTAEDISIPDAADVFTGNIEITTSDEYNWTGTLRSGDKLYDYTYDNMKTSTYMEVSTTDTTVAISSVSVNDGETVSGTANTVKFTPTATDSAAAQQIFVLAKACDANGILTSAAVYSGSADGAEHTLTLGGGESIKLYVWNAADGLKPLKKIRTYYTADTAAE